MLKTYTAAIYSRFDGLYYSVRYLDFNDYRGEDVDYPPSNGDALQPELQALVNRMKAEGKSIPEPHLKKYEFFRSSYGEDCTYLQVTVEV